MSLHVVAVGGSCRSVSSTSGVLKRILTHCADYGASTSLWDGDRLDLPMYRPDRTPTETASCLLRELRAADAVILGSPSYHGGVSGFVKNAIDYTEYLAGDARPYFDSLPVACVATGSGWQGVTSTMRALREIVHALRGWPTPLGICVNTAEVPLSGMGQVEVQLDNRLASVAEQLISMAEHTTPRLVTQVS